MPKGSNKMKIAGLIACISAGFVAGLCIYTMIQLSNMSSSYIFYQAGVDSSSVYGVLAAFIIVHIYRAIAGAYAVSKAEKPQKAGGAMANAIIALIFSAIWMMLMIYSANRTASLNALGVILLVLSIADVVMFIVVIVGTVQNGNKVIVNSWGPSPYGGYNQMPGGMPGQYPQQPQQPYGYQNDPYANRQQYTPFGYQQPYGAPQQGGFTDPRFAQQPYQQQYNNPYGAQPQQGGYYQQPMQPQYQQQPYQSQQPTQQAQQPQQPQQAQPVNAAASTDHPQSPHSEPVTADSPTQGE